MKIIADEGVDKPIVDELRRRGHDVTYIAELSPAISDDAVLDCAKQESGVLLTSDKDFGELVFRLGKVHTGVVLIRLAGVTAKAGIVASAFQEYGQEMTRNFTVISTDSVRIRRSGL